MSDQRSEDYTLDLYIHNALKDLVNTMESMYKLIYTLILGLPSKLTSLKVFFKLIYSFQKFFLREINISILWKQFFLLYGNKYFQ